MNFGSDVLIPSAITPTSITVTIPVAEFATVRTLSVSVTNPGTAPSVSLPFTSLTKDLCLFPLP